MDDYKTNEQKSKSKEVKSMSEQFSEPKFHVGQSVLYRDGLAIVYGYIFVGRLVLYDLTPPDAPRPQEFGDMKVRGHTLLRNHA